MQATQQFILWLDALEQDLAQPKGSEDRREAVDQLFNLWYNYEER
jgi:hypothetical protein